MAAEHPNYEEYTLDELRDAWQWVDPKKDPEVARAIEDEIACRESNAEPPAGYYNPEIPPKEALAKAHPFRRFIAFSVDMMIVGTVWRIIEQFIAVPVPAFVIALIRVAVFLLYFMMFHSSPNPVMSPGKMIMKLRLLDEQDEAPSQAHCLGRFGFLAAIFAVNWSDVVLESSPVPVPTIAPLLLYTLGVGVMISNGLLAVFDPAGLTVHDRLAGTRVRKKVALGDVDAGGSVPDPSSRRLRATPFVVPSLILAALLTFGGMVWLGGVPAERLTGSGLFEPSPEYEDSARHLEQEIARELGLRAEVGITQGWHSQTGEPTRRTLTIGVVVSFLRGSESDMSSIVELICEQLTVTEGLYDEILIEIEKGFLIKQTRIFPLSVNRQPWADEEDSAKRAAEAGKYPQAKMHYSNVLAQQTDILGPDHVDLGVTLICLGDICVRIGRLDDAEAYMQRALELRVAALGDWNAPVAQSLYNLGYIREQAGRYTEADSLYEMSIEMTREVLGGNHPRVAHFVHQRGFLKSAEGKFAAAESLFREASEILLNGSGDESELYLRSLLGIADALEKQERREEADFRFQLALDAAQSTWRTVPAATATVLTEWAGACRARGDCERAVPMYERAIDIYEKSRFADDPNLGVLRDDLAACREITGEG